MQNNGNAVRALLAKHRLTQAWLQVELEKRGYSVTKSTLSAVLLGRTSDRQGLAEQSMRILAEYEARYAGV